MPRKPTSPFYFDRKAADRVCQFFEEVLVHVKGEWAGQPFILEPWQRKILRSLFGWKRRSDGTRRYRKLYVECPRKNGKSFFGAGLALYLLCADGEPGAEVYSAAADRDQAAIVFDMARQMVENSESLSGELKHFRRSIIHHASASAYHVLSADAYTKHGKNPHGIIFDELHAQPNRELWDVLLTGTGARRQPIIAAITTAGYDRNSICWELHTYAERVLDGTVDDTSFLPVIFAAGIDADWEDPKVWKKANPNLGVSVKLEYMREECARAKESPAYQNTFRRLHLSQWTEQSERWMPMSRWDACATPVDPDELTDADCFIGLDLASTQDITAAVLVFPSDDGTFDVLPRFWIPEDGMRQRVKRDRVPYDVWVRDGFMFTTTGNVTDYEAIRHQIHEDAKKFNVLEIAYDTWNSSQLATQLQDDGLTIVPFVQGIKSFAGPTSELLRLVVGGQINHGGHPVLRWMAGNMTVKQDAAGNFKPDKAKSTERIDGIVATIMALGRAIVQPEQQPSVYEERGVLAL